MAWGKGASRNAISRVTYILNDALFKWNWYAGDFPDK